MGVLNYCLPEKDSITISDDKLINVIKRELARLLGFHPSIFGSEKLMSAKIPPFMGVLNYCLPEKDSITISDDKLINVIKRELARLLVSSFQFMKYGRRTLTYR
ncbi:unnamed protein product [Schistosoma bovis]|nr:unnamed protein product [Schistosoma bovis]